MYSIWASTDLSDIIPNDFFSYLKFQRGNRFYQLSHQPQCKLQLLFLHLDVSCTHLPPYQFKIDTTASRAKSISKTAIFMFLMRLQKDIPNFTRISFTNKSLYIHKIFISLSEKMHAKTYWRIAFWNHLGAMWIYLTFKIIKSSWVQFYLTTFFG